MASRFRKPVLSGWALFEEFQRLSKNSKQYIPPTWYGVVAKVPPPRGGEISTGTKVRGTISFPDTQMKRRMEQLSKHAVVASRAGLTPLPHWFERRPIDEALLEVKQIMKDRPNWTERDAILYWDKLMERRSQIRKRESELLREESYKRSKSATQQGGEATVLTPNDSNEMLKLLKDIQVESEMKRNVRIQHTAEYVEEYEEVLPPGLTEEMSSEFYNSFNGAVSQVLSRYKVEKKLIKEEEKLLNEKEVKYRQLSIAHRLHPTVLRKMSFALEVQDIVMEIINIKRQFGPVDSVFTTGDYMSVLDFMAVFVRSYDINKIPATSSEWGKDRFYYPGIVGSKRVYDVLRVKHEEFREKFERFILAETVELNVSKVLSGIDLGFGGNHPFEDRGPYESPLDLIDTLNYNFKPIISKLKQYEWKEHNKLEEYREDMEKLFKLLEVYLEVVEVQSKVESYRPVVLPDLEKDELDKIFDENYGTTDANDLFTSDDSNSKISADDILDSLLKMSSK